MDVLVATVPPWLARKLDQHEKYRVWKFVYEIDNNDGRCCEVKG